jgi:hypothetical protein
MLTPTGRVAHSIRVTLGSIVCEPLPQCIHPTVRDTGCGDALSSVLAPHSTKAIQVESQLNDGRRHINDGCGHAALSNMNCKWFNFFTFLQAGGSRFGDASAIIRGSERSGTKGSINDSTYCTVGSLRGKVWRTG